MGNESKRDNRTDWRGPILTNRRSKGAGLSIEPRNVNKKGWNLIVG